MHVEKFFSRLWDTYLSMAPEAGRIRALIESEFGPVQNDHVAFRTFNRFPIALEDLEPAFFAWGYERHRRYDFSDKHLRAYGYTPPHPNLPLVFLSELLVEELPTDCRRWVERALSGARFPKSPAEKLLVRRTWEMPSWAEYQMLESVSAYAAWMSVWGLCANHFTVAVHELEGAPPLTDVVERLRSSGVAMNEVGGVIKGSPDQLLEQAATLAESRLVSFHTVPAGSRHEKHEVPSCYYEFARRYPDQDDKLYLGFVAASANDIFESTTAQKGDRSYGSSRT